MKILGLLMITAIVYPFTMAYCQTSEERKYSFEQRDKYLVNLHGKHLQLKKNLKLSDAFKVLGSPQDISSADTPNILYVWGLDVKNSPKLIINANPKKDRIRDWLIVWLQEDKIDSVIASTHPANSRRHLIPMLLEMIQSRKMGRVICPDGLWCTTLNRTIAHGYPFEINSTYDVVGPSIWVTLYNVGVSPTDFNKTWQIQFVVQSPIGKTYIYKKELLLRRIDQVHQVTVPFFFWITKNMSKTEVQIGTYRYYAIFGGARSRTQEVVVHRQAFVIPSPNSADTEIVITPYYDRLPIHGLKYHKLVKRCRRVLSKKYYKKLKDVQIPAYSYLEWGEGDSTYAMEEEEFFPLSDFAQVLERKK